MLLAEDAGVAAPTAPFAEEMRADRVLAAAGITPERYAAFPPPAAGAFPARDAYPPFSDFERKYLVPIGEVVRRLPGGELGLAVTTDEFRKEYEKNAAAFWAQPGHPRLFGAPIFKDLATLAGLAVAGPLFPVAYAMNVVGEEMQKGTPLPEALAKGATAGMAAEMGGHLIGRGLKTVGALPLDLRSPMVRGMAERMAAQGVPVPPSMQISPLLDLGGRYAKALEREQYPLWSNAKETVARNQAARKAAAKVLGVPRTATEAQIRSAYRIHARKYHPDLNPDPRAAETFKKGADAYEILMRQFQRPGQWRYAERPALPRPIRAREIESRAQPPPAAAPPAGRPAAPAPDAEAARTPSVKTAQDMIRLVASDVQPTGALTRGGDYYAALLRDLPDADLVKVLAWSRTQGDFVHRWFGGNVAAEMRGRGLRPERALAESTAARLVREDLGRLPDEAARAVRLPAAPIRLAAEDLPHIEAKHGAQIRAAGYRDARSLIQDVAANFSRIYRGRAGALLLAKPNGKVGLAFVELAPDAEGKFYRVTTAFVSRTGYLKNKPLLWERAPAVQPPKRPPGAISGQTKGSAGNLPAPPPSVKAARRNFLDALTGAERGELAELAPSIRREFYVRGPLSLEGHAQLARYGSILFRAGWRTYAPWAREMVRRLGRAIRRFLWKIWARVKEFHRERTGAGGRQAEPGSPRKFFQIARAAGLSKAERGRLWEALRQAHPTATPEGVAEVAGTPPARTARALDEWRRHLETWGIDRAEREASRTGATHLFPETLGEIQPWTMTRAHFMRAYLAEIGWFSGKPKRHALTGRRREAVDEMFDQRAASDIHAASVENAVSAGEPVAPKVLADYPDLAARHGRPGAAPGGPAEKAATPQNISHVARQILNMAVKELALPNADVKTINQLARTIAAMDGAAKVQAHHMAEAIQYRNPAQLRDWVATADDAMIASITKKAAGNAARESALRAMEISPEGHAWAGQRALDVARNAGWQNVVGPAPAAREAAPGAPVAAAPPPPKKPPEAPPAAAPAPGPGPGEALFIGTRPGPSGAVPVWRLEGGPRAGEEVAALPSEIEALGYRIAGGPLTDVPGAAPRPAAGAGAAAEAGGKTQVAYVRDDPGPFGDLSVWRIVSGPRAGEEVWALPTELEARGYEIVARPPAPATPKPPRPLPAGRALARTFELEAEARRALAEGRAAMREHGLETPEWGEPFALTLFDKRFAGERIFYEPGKSEHGTEIAELMQGRRGLRRYFTRNPSGMHIDQVVETINREMGGGSGVGESAGISIDDFLDLLVKRADRRAGRIRPDAAAELRQMADALQDVQPDLAERLRTAARSVESAVAQQGREERAAIKEHPAEIERRRAAEAAKAAAEAEAAAKAEEARAAGRAAEEAETRAALERLRAEAEIAGLEREKAGLTTAVRTAEAAGDIRAEAAAERARLKARADVENVRAELKARLAEAAGQVEAHRARFLEAVRRLPPEVRAKMLARGVNLETAADLTKALELADKYLEGHLNSDAGEDLQRTARLIVRHAREFGPEHARIVREARRYAEMGREELGGLTLDDLEEISGELADAWHQHRTRGLLLTAQGEASAEDAARQVWSDALGRTPRGVGLEPGPQEIGRKAPWWKRLFREVQCHADTLVEQVLGPEGGRASRMFVDDVGVEAGQGYYRWVCAGTDVLDDAARAAAGGDARSERFIQWLLEPLTFDLPHVGRLSAQRRFWLKVWQTAGDPDAVSHLFPPSEYASRPGWVWETYKQREVPMDWWPQDLAAFREQFSARDAPGVRFADALKAFLNRDDWYEAQDAVHYALEGRHIVRVYDRAATHFNWRLEKPQEPPATVAAWSQDVMRRMGRFKERLAGGRAVSFVVHDAVADFLQELYEGAAYIAYARPIRNAFTVLGTPLRLSEAGAGKTLEGHLLRHFGPTVPGYLRDHLAHIMSNRRMAPAPLQAMSAEERAASRLIDNTTRAAVSWKLTPMLNQMPQVFAALADTRPIPPGPWARATWKVVGDPAAVEAAWQDLRRLAPQIRYREEVGSVLGLLNPATYARQGYSRRRALRELERFADKGMRGMTWVDKRIRVRDYIAFLEMAQAEGLAGEEAKARAARETLRMMVRTDAPQDPAYESEIGRLARRSVGAKALTAFTQGPNQQYNMGIRAVGQYAQDGDAGGLAYRLAILAGAMTGAFTLTGLGAAFLYGGFALAPEKRRSFAGEYVENALRPIYGASEAWNLLRARSGYEAEPRHTPVYSATLRTLKGAVDLKRALAEARPESARRGAVSILRGGTALLGIPTDQAFQLARTVEGLRAARGGPGKGRVERRGAKGEGARARPPGGRPRTIADWMRRARGRRTSSRRTRGRTIREWIEKARARRRAAQD